MNDMTSSPASNAYKLGSSEGDGRGRRCEKLRPYSRAHFASFNVVDMIQKIEFALAYLTSFDGFESILWAFGVTIDVEDGDLVYAAEGQYRTGYSAERIGKLRDLDELNQRFQENYERYQPESTGSVVPGWDVDALVPPEAIERARSLDIADYCKREGIALTMSADGDTVLSNRTCVALDRDRWINAKNRTQGALLEFVANYKRVTFVQAIAEINNTPALLAIERLYGEVKQNFTSFYLSRDRALDWRDSRDRVVLFLSAIGADRNAAPSLVGSGLVEAREDGRIRFYGIGRRGEYLEFTEDEGGEWSGRVEGRIITPFYRSQGKGPTVRLFIDPLTFVRTRGREALANRKRKDGILVLLSPEVTPVDAYLDENKHVRRVQHVPASGREPSSVDLDYIIALRARCAAHGVELDTSDFKRAVADKIYG